ncbi:SDR family oxidoreductase [Nonomuraea sp. FMUSA5-5]|uniref:SDR family oxidoreductase n=1 Tax=Nonomuraea composti TaxID=2720023 RepID=A0ABX1BJN8_9ACTN|nr:SDR family oxidoreductase [Nonomuraea sp. FMUSA5-5]NJP96001.1 SDR family oxidoreductase [Nonomuraea sp. FMUSA5-5]
MPTYGTSRGGVVVTGASTGIGQATALGLTKAGYHVFAGVRKEADGEALQRQAGEGLTPLILDVTDQHAVREAAKTVDKSDVPLVGLVNNAGIGLTWPVEAIPLETLRWQFEVNVFGQVGVIQEFLPALRRTKGRIINIGSIGDRLTLPFGAPLCSSKWAFASVTEALRMELHPWGIHVVLIEPATISTTAVQKLRKDAEDTLIQMTAEQRGYYETTYRAMTAKAYEREQGGSDPSVVAKVVLQALTAARPATRYKVGKDSGLLAFVARWLPDRVFDQARFKLFDLPGKFGSLS